jgi:hypothetical protein
MNSNVFKFLMLLMACLFNFTACAATTTRDCVDCSRKTIAADAMPDKKAALELKKAVAEPIELASKSALVITKADVARSPAGENGSSKDSYQRASCMKFEMCQDTVDVETLFEDMEESPYTSSVNEFWTTPVCHAPLKNDTNVPIIFNTASNPVKNEFFPKVVHDYFVNDKKNLQTWLNVINTKTSDGLTFLDFLQFNIDKGFYSVKSDKDAAIRVVSYICKNGGVYSKFKDTAKCP